VIDGTTPSHPLAGQVVRLAVVERGSSSERQGVSDAQGRFAFTGLPVGGIRVFLLGTEHQGVPYESERIVLAASSPMRSIALTVYDRARDRSGVRVGLVFSIVEIARGGVRVSIIQRYENPTDRTAGATARDALTFPLPQNAEAVSFLAGWRDPRIVAGRITDTIPIPPGAQEVAYTYGLQARRSALVVPWGLPDGAVDVEVLVGDHGVRIAGDGLHRAGSVAKAGHSYERWSGGPIPPGGQVSVRLEGVPVVHDTGPGAVAAVLALVLGGSLAVALRRRV
jgi:hypothetical protein